MDLVVLNTDLDAISVIDTYSSLIWTDRYNEYGDFEIYTRMTEDVLSYIKQDYYLRSRDSEHLMIIEKLLISSDTEEGNNLTVTGRSLESLLDRRIVWGQKSIRGNLQNGIKTLLDENVISPSNTNRKIENFVFETSTDPAITELTIDAQYTGDNLYEVIQRICSERGIGFKVTLSDDKKFIFQLYAGTDRSYEQTVNPYVVFSPNFDNLVSSNYIESKSSLKNVTLVGGEGEGTARRYTAVGDVSGLDRREIFTDARDISSDMDEDMTPLFVFTEFPSQVYSVSSNTFVTDALFNSSTADVSSYIGRTLSVSIPQYSNASGVAPNYAAVFLDASGNYLSTAKVWEKYEGASNTGMLIDYEIVVPEGAKFLYASMYSQKAVTDGVYYGETTDFTCTSVKLSNTEYIAQLRQRGSETLSENTDVVSFEGEAETTSMFKYGEDFFNGDIVQITNEYGHEARARILEMVVSESAEGHTVYPTFSTIDSKDSGALPSGYIRMTAIESSGTQYIDTGLKPNQYTRLICDFQFVGQYSSFTTIFGTRDANSTTAANMFSLSISSANQFRSDYFGSPVNITVPSLSARMKVDKNKNVTTIGDLTATNTAVQSGECANNLFLFGMNNVGNAQYMSATRIYYCQIFNDNLLVRNYVPCKNPSNVVGLFDTVNQMFYANSGTGTFTAI